MAKHVFICSTCGHSCVDETSKGVHVCPHDGTEMAWDLCGGGICLDGDYNFTSASMAIHPSQTAEHKRMFPDVGVMPDGCLHFDSVKKRERYMDACGFHKPMKYS